MTRKHWAVLAAGGAVVLVAVAYLFGRPVVEFVANLFDTSDFPARWHSGNWSTKHGWLHILSDLFVFGAYFAIPVVLTLFILRRKDVPFPPIFWLFAASILALGIGHLIEATIFWQPWYRLSGVVKFFTAVVAWATVVALIPVLPKALALPSRLADIQAIIEHAPVSMLMIDQQGSIRLVNERTEVMFGYRRSDLIGQKIEILVPDAVRPHHPELRHSYFRQPTVRNLGGGRPLHGRHQEGHDIPVAVALSPLHLSGEPMVLACIVDQTIVNGLASREKELEISKVLALAEVVGGLAHELNTPLQRITTWSGVLKLSPEQQREAVEGIVSAAKEAGEVVRKLRDTIIGREPAHKPLQLNTLIRETLQVMRKDITGVRTELAEPLPLVSADPLELQLVLTNLIRNANQAGGPVTVITTARDGSLVCAVEDCGPGFKVEPKRLFEPFYTTKQEGLGMGLTLTQAIIRRCGGSISASNTGHGARFEFTLPLKEAGSEENGVRRFLPVRSA